jgi:glycosyltransferase involved in cell wall biosynthesis
MQSRSPLTRPQPSTQSSGAVDVRLVVLVPAYNPGGILIETVRALLAFHPDVWLLVDGSTDGSDLGIESHLGAHRGFRVLRRSRNLGKGATLLEGAKNADVQNFTHILTFDSDGQHPPEHVPEFRGLCQRFPEALIMGEPRFGSDAPFERVFFRWIANALVLLETFGRIRCDSLFGMRAYPIRSFLAAFAESAGGMRYDFDTEIAVRLGWAGLNVIGVGVPVCYPSREAGGVSHYRYVHDNLVLAWAHGRLLCNALARFLRGGLPKGTAGIEQRISGAGS